MSSIVNRRDQDRHYRRVQVRFWPQGESQAVQGITNNLSLQGTFVNSHKIFPRGTRLRVELQLAGSILNLEGIVAHAHRIPPELRALGTQGMGIRFLTPEELLRPVLGGKGATTTPTKSRAEAQKVYPVRFESPKRFLDCFRRDLVNGGIFVRTTRPSRMREIVSIELHLPAPEARMIEARGRVVQVLEPRSTPTGNAAGGMGLELIDLEALIEALTPIVQRLETLEQSLEKGA